MYLKKKISDTKKIKHNIHTSKAKFCNIYSMFLSATTMICLVKCKWLINWHIMQLIRCFVFFSRKCKCVGEVMTKLLKNWKKKKTSSSINKWINKTKMHNRIQSHSVCSTISDGWSFNLANLVQQLPKTGV